MKLWKIEATAVQKKESDGGDCRVSTQIPTFYLHPDVQAIRDGKHACEIARKVIDPFGVLIVYPCAALEEDGVIIESSYAAADFGPEKTE